MPFLCALTAVHECWEGGACEATSADNANVPRFVRVDIGQRMVSAVGRDSRSSPIEQVDRRDGRLILHGGQNGRAWSVLITEDTGALSATVLDEGGALALFGACTVP